ncbi:MAG: hypothetical protein Q4B63_10590 [Clostridium perfringens]|nr:hypothetical protein [Clostridium perfringens]
MEDIRSTILSIKSLAKEDSLDDKVFKEKILDLIEGLANKIEEIQVNIETLDENVSLINDDLSEVQDEIFEEVTFEELEEFEEDYLEVLCTNCKKTLYVEKSVLRNKEEIPCPYCNNRFKV